MLSLRRYYLDKLLFQNIHFIKGKVIDAGGNKQVKRGYFDASEVNANITYLNIDPTTNPDILGNVDNIPCDDSSFDCLLATELLEYTKEPKIVLREFYRILNNDSFVLLSIPFLHPIHSDFQFDRIRFTRLYIEEISKQVGFEVISTEAMGSVGGVIFDILKVTFGYASKNRFRNIYSVILSLFRPFFLFLDRITKNQSDYINTGYFVILRK